MPPPSWLAPDDLFFGLGLSASVTAIYLLFNGTFAALDYWGLCAR